jgi:hypothetical protein
LKHLQNHLNLAAIIVIVIPSIIYVLHALRFGTWIVDDAAITFTYSRNFAHGYGLVSQPGMSPVEGYSNFAWVLLLSPFFLLNVFDPVITPKLISFLLIVGTFIVLYQMLKPLPGSHWVAFAAFTLTALNTSFVVWTISGLENPLYVFLVSLLLWWSTRVLSGETDARNALWIGVMAALIAITRPDGLAYVLAFPATLIPAQKTLWKRKILLLLLYSAIFGGLYGLFILFRLAYFGVPMPNTYYMKGAFGLQDIINLLTLQPQMVTKAQVLLQQCIGILNIILPLLLVIGSFYLLLVRQWTERVWTTLVFMLCSLSIYLLLPPDWMGEYRFATPFSPLFYLYSALIIEAVVKQLPSFIYKPILIILTVLAIIATFNLYTPRSEAFRQNPTVPVQYIRTTYTDKFEWYKNILGLESASVLLPDVGAMIYYSSLTVYDIAGLTDQTVARFLGRSIYRPGFYDYVFETIRPTFIHTHAFWTQHSRLEDDPRFAELYVPICAYTDPWIEQNYGISRQSGDFILRCIAEAHPDELIMLRQRLADDCTLDTPQ